MNLREAAQQALDALERSDKISGHGNNRKTVAALRAALAEDAMQRLTDVQQETEPTSQETRQVDPVAYMSMCFSNGQTKPHSKTLFWPEQYTGRTGPVDAGAWGEEVVVPLYDAPPKRYPLTEAQLVEAYCCVNDKEWAIGGMTDARIFARAIERAHGIGGEE